MNFNLKQPGTKEYVIIGILALGAGYIYLRHKNATAAAAAANQQAQGTPVVLAAGNGGGVPFGAFFAWIQNHQSSPPRKPPPPKPPDKDQDKDKNKKDQDHGDHR